MEREGPKKKPDHCLQVFFDAKTREVHVEGNKAGLEYFIAACSAVIGQAPGGNHWHLGETFNTLEPGSLDLIICYRADLKTGNTGAVPNSTT